MTVSNINGILFTALSALDGRTLSTLTAVDGQTILASTTQIFDEFTRANSGTLGTCPTGAVCPQAWAIGGGLGTWAIVSNRAVYTHAAGASSNVFLNAFASDVTVSATLVTVKTGNGLWFRGDSPDGFLFVVNSATEYGAYKLQSGAFTQVFVTAANDPTPTNGDVLKVILNGSSISFYVNNVLLTGSGFSNPITNTYKQTQPNFGFYGGNAAANDGGTWDDFLVTTP